tara:strand:+ start:248 stop:370 length:123 start_codon:yes stop_codon:yes gene_type:complete
MDMLFNDHAYSMMQEKSARHITWAADPTEITDFWISVDGR